MQGLSESVRNATILSDDSDCRSSLSERASAALIFSNLSSVSPKADESAATAVSPAVVAATNSVIANDDRDAPALRGRSSLDLPAASSGVAGLSDCIGDIDADLEAAISALEVSWLRCGIIMNHMTFRSCALSETDASMFSIKPDAAARVIPIEAANNSATGDSNAH